MTDVNALVVMLRRYLSVLGVYDRTAPDICDEFNAVIKELSTSSDFVRAWKITLGVDKLALQYLHVLCYEVSYLYLTSLKDLPWGLGAFATDTEETWVCLGKNMCAMLYVQKKYNCNITISRNRQLSTRTASLHNSRSLPCGI